MTYDPSNDGISRGPADNTPSGPHQKIATAPANLVHAETSNADPELLLGAAAMSNLHLSGSDPRMFPGIYTRGQRNGSFKSLDSFAKD